jgi:uncharacterized SAM-binding protein YcdF (DUF218 family)
LTVTTPQPTAAAATKRSRGRRVLRGVVGGVLVLGLVLGLWVASVAGRVWYVARQDDRQPVDAIVVLGASQYDGTPTSVFAARLDHAAALWDDGVAPVVITVGGKLPGDRFTEAGSGRTYLLAHGVAARSVIAVPRGHDTWNSLKAVRQVMVARGWDSVALVSDPWHEFRAREMSERLGLVATTSPTRSGPAVLTRSAELRSIARETAAYVWWRVGGGAPWRGPDIA